MTLETKIKPCSVSWGQLVEAPAGNYPSLVTAILRRAGLDARHGRGETSREARAWLIVEGGELFDYLGIETQPMARAIEAMPPLRPAPAWKTLLVTVIRGAAEWTE